jgi:hypothetical protein
MSSDQERMLYYVIDGEIKYDLGRYLCYNDDQEGEWYFQDVNQGFSNHNVFDTYDDAKTADLAMIKERINLYQRKLIVLLGDWK